MGCDDRKACSPPAVRRREAVRTGTRRRKPRREQPGQGAGIITAEELAILDLSNCEIVVLSACGTNVGIRRAGQGIQSLQSALHAPGARTSLTSPWKVDDAAPRRLMELFYTRLWEEKLGKAEALWQAKMALWTEGHPVRDWVVRVLTGTRIEWPEISVV